MDGQFYFMHMQHYFTETNMPDTTQKKFHVSV